MSQRPNDYVETKSTGDELRSIADYAMLGDEPAILSIDDMKCCGNCHHRESMDNGDNFIECCSMRNNMASWQVCDKWKYDNVAKKRRELWIS